MLYGQISPAWKQSRCECKKRENCTQARSIQCRHANTTDTYGVMWARAPQILYPASPEKKMNRHVDHNARMKSTCAPMARGRERASIVSRCCTQKQVATLALSFPVQYVAPILKGTEVDRDNGWPAAPDKACEYVRLYAANLERTALAAFLMARGSLVTWTIGRIAIFAQRKSEDLQIVASGRMRTAPEPPHDGSAHVTQNRQG